MNWKVYDGYSHSNHQKGRYCSTVTEYTQIEPTPYIHAGEKRVSIIKDEFISNQKDEGEEDAWCRWYPNVALKTDTKANSYVPEMCPAGEGHSPPLWKKRKQVHIATKTGMLCDKPGSFRPIGLLDALARLLEMVIFNRLTSFTEEEQGLSRMQFGE